MKTIAKDQNIDAIYYFFSSQTNAEYTKFKACYHAQDFYPCPLCCNKTKFYRHGFYTPSYYPGSLLLVQCSSCGHTSVIYPLHLKKTGKISFLDQLNLTKEYITTCATYRKIAKKYNICTSYAYKIVKRYQDYDFQALNKYILMIDPDFDLTGCITMSLPVNKPYRLAQTPAKLLNALQCVELIKKITGSIPARYSYFDSQNLLNKLPFNKTQNRLLFFPYRSEQDVSFFCTITKV